VLPYGKDAVVLAPDELVEDMRRETRMLEALYRSRKPGTGKRKTK
jgi:predicted DNA-binding transcriptional regulator YafY